MVRIEVVNHFNEDAFSHGLLEGLASRLRNDLRAISCDEHGDEPTIRLSTEGVAQVVNDITIEVNSCCEAAEKRVLEIVNEIRKAEG